MSSSGIDISELSESERAALETYTAVTSQGISEAVPLLCRSQWNVQVSLDLRDAVDGESRHADAYGRGDCCLQVF